MMEVKTLLMTYSAVMAPLVLLIASLIILQFKMLSGIGRELRDTREQLGRELAAIKEKLEHTATKEEMLSIKEELKDDLQKQAETMLSIKEELKDDLQRQSERLMRVEYALTYSRDGTAENLPEKGALKVGEKEPQKYNKAKK